VSRVAARPSDWLEATTGAPEIGVPLVPHEAPLDESSPLLTDLYELAMLHVYHEQGMDQIAVFELFMRKLPERRSFLLAAGLEQALVYLQHLRFTERELGWLAETGRFSAAFLDYLAEFRFTGDVHAMPEGTVFFANEPILRVTAPLPEAQLVESRLMNILHLQTLIASKAARFKLAAPEVPLVDFGLRRAHGAEAGLFAARASYLAGFAGTATVLAGMRYGIPIFGTMAHSFIQAHGSESLAFEHFARTRPHDVTLLIDTYDIETGARHAIETAQRLARDGIQVNAVRIDSGDLIRDSRRVREMLDQAGLHEVGVFLSGSLDDGRIKELVEAGAPVSGFGVGTSLDVSPDAPYLDCVYKLQEYAGEPRRKRSAGKSTWPGRKQVYRRFDAAGRMCGDTVCLESDPPRGRPLLVKVMEHGRRLSAPAGLEELRERAAESLAALPPGLRELDGGSPYPVEIAESVRALAAQVDRATR